MNQIAELPFAKIFFDESTKIMQSAWKEQNEDMTSQEIKQLISEVAEIMKTYSLIGYVADDSNRLCVYDIPIQSWIASTLAEAAIVAGVKKYAVIPPQELIAQLSTEQTSDEVGEIPFEIKYFKDTESALKWVNSK